MKDFATFSEIYRIPCPCESDSFVYFAESDFQGDALKLYRCCMYTILDYQGPPLNIVAVLQKELTKIFSNGDIKFLNVAAGVLLTRLLDFDDEFCDYCLSELLREDLRVNLGDNFIKDLQRLASDLMNRGKALPRYTELLPEK